MKKLLYLLAVSVLSISLVACGGNSEQKSQTTPEQPKQEESKKEVSKDDNIESDLGVDIDTFIKNFNSSNTVKGLGVTLDKSNGKIETKDNADRFLINVSNIDISMTLVKGTEKISGISVQSGGFGKQTTGEENIPIYGCFIKGLRPDISDADIIQLMGKNGWIDKSLKSGQKYNIDIDDITFELLSLKDKDMGTMLTIKKIK